MGDREIVRDASDRIASIIHDLPENLRGEVYQELSNLPGCGSTKQDITDILRSNSLAFPELPKGQITDTEEALNIVHRFDDCLSSTRSLEAHGSASDAELEKLKQEQRKVFEQIIGKLEGLETAELNSKRAIGRSITSQKRQLKVKLLDSNEESVSIGATQRGKCGYWQPRFTRGGASDSSPKFPKLQVKYNHHS